MNQPTALLKAPASGRDGRAARRNDRSSKTSERSTRATKGLAMSRAGATKRGAAVNAAATGAANGAQSIAPAATMPKRVHAALAIEGVAALPAALESSIRREFFCTATAAANFRVSVDEVIGHLADSGLALAPRPQRSIANLADVMVAVACVRGDAAAWTHLLNAHSWCLDRACAEQLGGSQGFAYARRFWSDLRTATMQRTVATTDASRPRTRLQAYMGVRPLRLWLADRLLGGASVCSNMPNTRAAPGSLDSAMGSRTLPPPSSGTGGTAT